jgi:hypothetical protein
MVNGEASRRSNSARRTTRDSSAGFVLPISMHALPDEEATTEMTTETSWLHVRVSFRKAIAFATLAATGSALASLLLLDVRAHVQSHHRGPVEVTAVDAPWTPLPSDAKPWTPAPYAPIRSSNP